MDLHVVAPLASRAERDAVDSVVSPRVGPPVSGWSGGARNPADSHVARGGHEARAHRDLLLPTLHAVQARIGYISQPALGYICRRLTIPPADAYGVATFYALLSTTPRPPAVVHVCDDIACRLAGAEELCADLGRSLGPAGQPALDGRATWMRSPCLGQCDRAPAVLFTIAGEAPETAIVAPIDAVGIVARLERASAGGLAAAAETTTAATPERLATIRQSVPQAGDDGLRLLARVGRIDPTSVDDFRAHGGYRALALAIEQGPRRVIEEVITGEVLGRGGAAFPAGKKWAAAAASTGRPKYIVCNADEAEPGTFKDRVLLEEDPFAIVEAMTIAGFAIGAEQGYLYIRGEYPLGEARMATAILRAREAGYLGPNVLGAGFAFDIEIRRGGGAYVCGEGTALFESIEGKRGEPRNKAGRSTTAGLFQRPTAVNNVETLVNVPGLLLDGGEAYAAIGTDRSNGTKLFALSGHVARPGVYEAPFGITIRDLIELGGGIPGGRAVKAILVGGAAGAFVGPESLHVPLTFEHMGEIGATLGSGGVMVFDETSDLLGMLRRIAAFFRDESCGQCVPCRVGTVRQEEVLARLVARRPNGSPADELALLRDLGQVMRDASICGLGQTASSAVESGLQLAGVLPS
jgi:NADH-quinone oxidoreductase subunit F